MVSEKLYRNTLSRTRQTKMWSVLENLTVLHCFRLCRLLLVFATCTLTLGRRSKFIPPPWYKGDRGGGVDGTPPWSFWYVTILRNDFDLSGKPLIFLTRWGIFYGWWSCWKACDVTNNGRHLGRHLGFYQELEIKLKPLEMVIFFVLHIKSNV